MDRNDKSDRHVRASRLVVAGSGAGTGREPLHGEGPSPFCALAGPIVGAKGDVNDISAVLLPAVTAENDQVIPAPGRGTAV